MKTILHLKKLKALIEESSSVDIFKAEDELTSFWVNNLNTRLNARLLSDNSFEQALKDDPYLYLVSATSRAPYELSGEGGIDAGAGCLGNVLYCVQAYKVSNKRYRLHNFGKNVRLYTHSGAFIPLLFRVESSSVKILGINYLRKGPIFEYIKNHSDILSHKEAKRDFEFYKKNVDIVSETYVRQCIEKFNKKILIADITEAISFINQHAELIQGFNFLSYIFFESVSLELMLSSTDEQTVSLKSEGELNNRLYIDLIQRLKTTTPGVKFDPYHFALNSVQLSSLLDSMHAQNVARIDYEKFFINVANNIIMYMGTSFYRESAIQGAIFHDFCMNQEYKEKHKIKMREYISRVYGDYMKVEDIDLVINTTIKKGEIGVCPTSPEKVGSALGRYSDDFGSVDYIQPLNLEIKPIKNFII